MAMSRMPTPSRSWVKAASGTTAPSVVLVESEMHRHKYRLTDTQPVAGEEYGFTVPERQTLSIELPANTDLYIFNAARFNSHVNVRTSYSTGFPIGLLLTLTKES